MLRRIGTGVGIFVPVAALVLAALAFWTPSVHTVSTPGARALHAHFAADSLQSPSGPMPAPTTSLSEIRCGAWQARSRQPCPDEATLAQRVWPGVDQAPATLYVALSGYSQWALGPVTSNVEYQPSSRTVTIHFCESRPLAFIPHHVDDTVGTQVAPAINLLIVSLDGISSGPLNVVEDYWIERINGDENQGASTLGTLTIP